MNWDDPARTETAYYSASKSAGPYRLLRLLRESASEQQWEGVRLHPHRPACIRLLAPPDPESGLRASLHQEVRRLSRIRHAELGSVFESGDTENGLIWLATELTEDPSLFDWMRENPAPHPLDPDSLQQRCRLAASICRAVHRAHLNGILHLALSPANVRISVSLPVRIKIVDAGLTPWLPQDAETESEYRSPEQRNADKVPDARADVYALGALLHTLLTGRGPAPSSAMDQEIALPKVHPEAGQILSRALHPDPERRFGSAESMAQALETVFEPKRRGVPQAGLAAALVVCLAACGWLFVRQRELSRDLAETTTLLRREQGVLGFLAGAFGAPAVVNTPEKTAHSRALLNEAVEAARRNHAGSPHALAARLNSLTEAYNQLGDYQTAVNLGKEALELNRARIRRETTELADSYGLLAINYYNLSRYAESAEAAIRASDLWRRLRPLDPESLASALSSVGQAYGAMGRYADADGPLSEAVALYKKHGIDGSLYLDALRARGVNLTRQGLPEEGLPMLREAVERFLSEQGNTSFSYLRALNDLGNALALSGKLPEAAARQSDLIGVVRKVMGAESPNLAISHLNLASTLTKLNNLERAGAELEAGLQIFRKSLGESHPRYGEFLRASGDLDSRAGRHDQALATLRQALAHEQRTLPPGSLNAGLTTASLAMAQQRAGRQADARQTAQEALTLLKGKLPETHPTLGELRGIP